MASKACMSRLQKEYKALLKEPVPHITAHPMPGNLLEWHYVLEGSEGTAFEGGKYHGVVTFPPQYPYKPPSVKMMTPNGRFAPNTKLCMSMTDFHPESWNPLWSVGTILTGLLSFMHDEAQATTGAIVTSAEEKRRLAAASMAANARSAAFRKVFPEMVEAFQKEQRELDEAQRRPVQQEKQSGAASGKGGEKHEGGPSSSAAAAAGSSGQQQQAAGGVAGIAAGVAAVALAAGAAGPSGADAAAAPPAAAAGAGAGKGGEAAPLPPARAAAGELMVLALAVAALAAVALPLVNAAGGWR